MKPTDTSLTWLVMEVMYVDSLLGMQVKSCCADRETAKNSATYYATTHPGRRFVIAQTVAEYFAGGVTEAVL